MSGVSRRGFLAGAGLTLAAVGGTGLVRGRDAAAAQCSPAERFDTATMSAAIVGATTLDGIGYVVTRGQTPPAIGVIDLASRAVTNVVRLDRGDGGWGATTAAGKIYVGTYPEADLYRFDPASAKATRIQSLGDSSTMVMCMTTTPNDKVYAGTYPTAQVWGHNPADGTTWKLATVTGEKYVRAIAADENNVYAGTLPGYRIVAISRTTGKVVDIAEPHAYGGAASMLASGGRVYGLFGNQLVDFAPDGSDVRVANGSAEDRLLDALTVAGDGTVYCVGRPSGTVYRRTAAGLEKIAAPVAGDEHRGVFALDEHTLVGAAGSGQLWWLDTGTGEAATLDLLDGDALPGPDRTQAVCAGSGDEVHIGGHFAITTHRPGVAEPRRLRVEGEPKQLRMIDGLLYAALYPSGELISIAPDTGKVTSYGQIGHGQIRPTDAKHLPENNLLLIASGPVASGLIGALTIVDLADHSLAVYPGVVPGQAVTSVAVENGIAYLSGDTWGGGSGTPTRTSASVVAFDIATRTVKWETVPLADHQRIDHVAVHNGVLYGVYKNPAGVWFAMDTATQKVLRQGTLSSYGELTVHQNTVYASVHRGAIYQLGPDLSEAKLLAEGLGDGWYTKPQLSFAGTSWKAWHLADRDLARVDLDPNCA